MYIIIYIPPWLFSFSMMILIETQLTFLPFILKRIVQETAVVSCDLMMLLFNY